jgi:hypothetical protein
MNLKITYFTFYGLYWASYDYQTKNIIADLNNDYCGFLSEVWDKVFIEDKWPWFALIETSNLKPTLLFKPGNLPYSTRKVIKLSPPATKTRWKIYNRDFNPALAIGYKENDETFWHRSLADIDYEIVESDIQPESKERFVRRLLSTETGLDEWAEPLPNICKELDTKAYNRWISEHTKQTEIRNKQKEIKPQHLFNNQGLKNVSITYFRQINGYYWDETEYESKLPETASLQEYWSEPPIAVGQYPGLRSPDYRDSNLGLIALIKVLSYPELNLTLRFQREYVERSPIIQAKVCNFYFGRIEPLLENEIKERAYQKYLTNPSQTDAQLNWLQAELEVKEEYNNRSIHISRG